VKLKLDENLGTRGAELFDQAGHDVSTVPQEGLCSSPDKKLLEICRAQKRCLITLALEFGNPLIFRPEDYSGIAVLHYSYGIALMRVIEDRYKGMRNPSLRQRCLRYREYS